MVVEQVYEREKRGITWLGGLTFGMKEAFLSKKWRVKM